MNSPLTTPSARRRAGLTLLELMIVLIILVMLFAIAGPRLLGSQKKADIKAHKEEMVRIVQRLLGTGPRSV